MSDRKMLPPTAKEIADEIADEVAAELHRLQTAPKSQLGADDLKSMPWQEVAKAHKEGRFKDLLAYKPRPPLGDSGEAA